jgi:hypothetical protein
MKTMKLTTALLALIGAAAFTTSAKASFGTTGDLILGLYDTTGANSDNLEANLGLVSSLTNGETWSLGTDISSVFTAADGTSNNVFTIAATGGGTTGGGGLTKDEIAVTTLGTILSDPSTTTVESNINNEYGATLTSVGTNPAAGEIALGGTDAFNVEVNHSSGSYGLTSTYAPEGVLAAYSNSSIVNLDEFNGGTAITELGTFQFDTSTGVLTYDAAAVPEPSTYALMLGGLLLLWVLKRRSSSVA